MWIAVLGILIMTVATVAYMTWVERILIAIAWLIVLIFWWRRKS